MLWWEILGRDANNSAPPMVCPSSCSLAEGRSFPPRVVSEELPTLSENSYPSQQDAWWRFLLGRGIIRVQGASWRKA